MLYQPIAKSQLEWLASLNPLEHAISSSNKFFRKTSIIATIGPKTNNVELLGALRKAGMNIVRLNASHGSHEYFKSVVDNARSAQSAAVGRPLAIALDTKGPEMRTGMMVNGEDVKISQGHEFYVTMDDAYAEKGSADYLYIDYKNLARKVEVGRQIFIDDGILALEVVNIESDLLVRVRAVNNGVLSNKKGVNLPLTEVDLPAISEKDRQDITFAVENDLDMIFASFIRRGSDVRTIREILGEKGAHIKIISKVENHQGVLNFDEILKESDGIMVARGDLGIEIPAPQVFMAQKMMIAKCNIAGKPVICATQMLESMIVNNRPTRAEVSDVANAVLDGADCVMLSGETAKGAYPIEAVTMMAETSFLAEQSISYVPLFNEMRSLTQVPTDTSETVAMAAVSASLEQQAGAILLMSTSGNTARLVSKYRPRCPILVITRDEHTARDVHLYRGCYPFLYPYLRPRDDSKWQEDVDNRIKYGLAEALKLGIVEKGDVVVALQGWRGGSSHTNSMRILAVPDAAREFVLEGTGRPAVPETWARN
ncbi:pyruvate kinase [Ceraceosorus guamensis]|uniref:Pyruvate kinase n=1 Tax=Ceraceosorus guamensis TaxID=1522189 RepID=A0A316W5B6_9BASI|nr:pyruvate kinase [Ceraceosorus guamensis]PWN45047.1 pyruvate kinase [Ceraceosorus guamensis]